MRLSALFSGPPARVLWFCWLGWAFDFFDLILFAFVKVDVQRELQLDLTEVAWIDGWTLAASALGGILFGRVADRFGRRRALSASILVYSAGALLTGLAGGHASLLAARIVTGLGVGGEWGVGHAAVAEAFPERQRGRAAGLLQAATPFGMGLAALVGSFVAPLIGWRACYLLAALPALLVVGARFAMPHDAPPAPGARRPLTALFEAPFRRASIVLLAVLVLHMTGFWCCFAWLPSALVREGGHSLAFVGTFHALLAAVHVVADVGFGFVADRLGRRKTFVACSLLFAAGLVAVAFGFDALGSAPGLWGFALVALGLGAGTWSAFGVLFAQHYPLGLRATAASGFYNLARGAQLVAQPAIAAAFGATGSFAVALWVGAGTALGSAWLIGRLPAVVTSRG